MRTRKNFTTYLTLALLASAALVASLPVIADQVSVEQRELVHQRIAGSATTTYATNGGVIPPKTILNIYPNQPITLECWARGTNAGTEAITVIAAPTINKTNVCLTHRWTFGFNLVSATQPGVLLTNADLSLFGAADGLAIISVQNAHASYVDVLITGKTSANAR